MFACLSVVWIAAKEVWWDGSGAEPKPAESASSTPSKPIEGTLGRTLATAPVGRHLLGQGWSIRVAPAVHGVTKVECLFDESFEAARSDTSRATRRTLVPIGSPHFLNLSELPNGRMNQHALEWNHEDEVIQVHFGTTQDDVFVRSPHATRCLYIGRGGTDRVVASKESRSMTEHDAFLDPNGVTTAPYFVDPPEASDRQNRDAAQSQASPRTGGGDMSD